jgi:hypothetical protein
MQQVVKQDANCRVPHWLSGAQPVIVYHTCLARGLVHGHCSLQNLSRLRYYGCHLHDTKEEIGEVRHLD